MKIGGETPTINFKIAVWTGGICLFFYAALKCLGFSSKGPRRNSYASNFQSSYGNVPKGSLFTSFQSSGQHFTPIIKIIVVIGLTIFIWKNLF